MTRCVWVAVDGATGFRAGRWAAYVFGTFPTEGTVSNLEARRKNPQVSAQSAADLSYTGSGEAREANFWAIRLPEELFAFRRCERTGGILRSAAARPAERDGEKRRHSSQNDGLCWADVDYGDDLISGEP